MWEKRSVFCGAFSKHPVEIIKQEVGRRPTFVDFHRCGIFHSAGCAIELGVVDDGKMKRAHRLRYDSTSPTAATVWHGRSSGDDALWSDIAYSDVVRVDETQDSTIGPAQDQSQVGVCLKGRK